MKKEKRKEDNQGPISSFGITVIKKTHHLMCLFYYNAC